MRNWFFNVETSMITSEGTPVAVVFNGDKADPYANARLIENAPDMLWLLDCISRGLWESGDDENLRAEIDALLRIIKADVSTPKNCPFCGGGADTKFENDWWFTFCLECGSQTDGQDTEEHAIKAWNQRAE